MRYRYGLLLILVLVGSGCPFIIHPKENLKISDVSARYSAPYLLDFTFSMHDKQGHAINQAPAAFTINAMESGDPISPTETAFLLARESRKQLKCFLVLDYTNSMFAAGAIDAMEEAAKAFVDDLSIDAQIGLFEFHRDSDPARVTGLTTNKAFLKERIDAIWTEFVQDFPGASRCWDAVYAAVQEFGGDSSDEGRYIIFLSDGRDESSQRTPDDIVTAATQNGVKIYCIGFGAELKPDDLRYITMNTDGEYYSSDDITELQDRFNQITEDLGGRYTLRWATLKRANANFVPSFEISLDKDSDTYTGAPYNPTDYAGDPYRGILRIPEYTINKGSATVYLRASYIPRYIRRIKLYMDTDYPCTVTAVGATDGGLCANWQNPIVTHDPVNGGSWVELKTSNPSDITTSIPFGAFGPILRFDFTLLPDDRVRLFNELYIDNSIYATTGGQSLEGVRIHYADPADALILEDFEDDLDPNVWRTDGSIIDDTVNIDNHCLRLEAAAALGANRALELKAAQALAGAQVDFWFRDLHLESGLLSSGNSNLTLYLYGNSGQTIGYCRQPYGSNLTVKFSGQNASVSNVNLYSLTGWHQLSVIYLSGATSTIRVLLDGTEIHNATVDADFGPFVKTTLRAEGMTGWVESSGYFDDIGIYSYTE